MRVRQHLPLSLAILYASVCLWLLPSIHAGPPGTINDAQLREAVAQAVKIAHPGATDESVKIRPRADLDDDLSKIAGKASGNVSFYETDTTPAVATAGDDSMWAVVSGDSLQASYKLYSFDSSDGFEQSSREFTRLISQLELSLDNHKAASLAQFFLGCCNRATHGEVVPDEDLLHHTIERDYLQTYGDVWRTLEAFTEWWQAYQQTSFQFPRAVIPEDGGAYRITVEIVAANFGMHPQLQQWNFELSAEGNVRVLSVQPIYPRENRWLSYDFRSTIAPRVQ
jgi:hypothetical protein